MKRWIFALVGGLLLVAAAAFFCTKLANRDKLTDLEKANIDALADSEIIVGTLCARNPNTTCTSLGITIDDHIKP